jgi:hypothetical protein
VIVELASPHVGYAARVRWLVLGVLLLVACEREGQPTLWRAPKVGDRGTGRFEYTAKIVGPDGATHVLTDTSEFTSELMELDGDFATKMRMTIAHQNHALDGVAKTGISGTFELTETPSKLEVVRVGGTLTEEERAFFTSGHHTTRATTDAKKRFLRQTFRPGQVLVLTPDEIVGLGFGMKSVEVTVTEVSAKQVVFTIKSAGELSGLSGTLDATGTLRLFDGGRELVQDGEILRDGKHIGTLHVEQWAHSL